MTATKSLKPRIFGRMEKAPSYGEVLKRWRAAMPPPPGHKRYTLEHTADAIREAFGRTIRPEQIGKWENDDGAPKGDGWWQLLWIYGVRVEQGPAPRLQPVREALADVRAELGDLRRAIEARSDKDVERIARAVIAAVQGSRDLRE